MAEDQPVYVNLTEDGGVQKKILETGEGTPPVSGMRCKMNYKGTLEDGSEFDSGQNFKFLLGKGEVIKGWEVGVATMKIGEKCLLQLAPAYAYGEAGAPPKIPPNATLIFEVELIGAKVPKKKKRNMTPEEKIQEANALKTEGT